MALHKARGETTVVAFQSANHILQCEPVALQRSRIRQHVVLLFVAANGIHVGDVRHGSQLRADQPILQRTQVCQSLHTIGEQFAVGCAIIAFVFKLDRPHQHLAKAGGDRPHRRLNASR